MKLDQKAVRFVPGKDDVIHFDDDLPGFGLRLRRSGDGRLRRTWVAQYRAKGRTRRMKIGAAEKVSADEARKAAKKILARVELGQDPQGDKATARLTATRTLRSVADDFLEVQQRKLRPASYRVTKLYLTGAYFKPLHATTVTEITTADIAARLRVITRDSGSVTASRARAALSALFKWAAGEGMLGRDPRNPVTMSNAPQDSVPRDRTLSDAELAAVWRSCADDDFGKIVKLLILSGCRRQEIGGMTWGEIDLDKGTLTLPKERVKNKHAHTLTLPESALSIIKSVPRLIGQDHVFGRVGFNNWWVAKHELDARLGDQVKPWRLHDVRRSCATGMANIGIQPFVVEAVLNHAKPKLVATYNRSNYTNEVRDALMRWADHVVALIDGRERKILPFSTGNKRHAVNALES